MCGPPQAVGRIQHPGLREQLRQGCAPDGTGTTHLACARVARWVANPKDSDRNRRDHPGGGKASVSINHAT